MFPEILERRLNDEGKKQGLIIKIKLVLFVISLIKIQSIKIQSFKNLVFLKLNDL